MTNIVEILKGLGIEVPTEKQSDLTKLVSENYKTVVEVDKKISKLEAERDNWKEQAESSAETLKGFEGKDFEAITRERDEWKTKNEELKAEYEKKLYDRDFTDALEKEIAQLKFTSESAKKSVIDEIKKEGLKFSNGKILGLNDFIGQIKERDKNAFVDEEAEKLKDEQPKFTDKVKTINKGVTVESIMAIKDRTERQKAMLENKALFGLE